MGEVTSVLKMKGRESWGGGEREILYSHIHQYFGQSYFLAIVSNAAMNMGANISQKKDIWVMWSLAPF